MGDEMVSFARSRELRCGMLATAHRVALELPGSVNRVELDHGPKARVVVDPHTVTVEQMRDALGLQPTYEPAPHAPHRVPGAWVWTLPSVLVVLPARVVPEVA